MDWPFAHFAQMAFFLSKPASESRGGGFNKKVKNLLAFEIPVY
jgi:hypothetical protein